MAVLGQKPPIAIIGAIIAGGRSRRMGADKTQLKFGERSLLEHASDTLSSAQIDTVYISHPDYIPDQFFNCGPLGGIEAILEATKDICTHVIFMPVDMPLMKPHLLGQLMAATHENLAVRFSKFAFPFRLANTTFVTKIVKQRLEDRRDLSLMALQASFNCIDLDIPISDSSAFTNLNSLDEWERFILSALSR